MDVSAVRAALASTVAANVTVDGVPLAAFAHMPDSIDPPLWISGQVEVDYDEVEEGGFDAVTVTGHLYTSTSDTVTGQRILDQLLARTGPTSIKAALEANQSLGGIATALHVQRFTGYGKYRIAMLEQPEVRYYGGRMFVRVWGP